MQRVRPSGLNHVLVVAPWLGIVDQLRRDMNGRVWERLGAQGPARLPHRAIAAPSEPGIDTENEHKFDGSRSLSPFRGWR